MNRDYMFQLQLAIVKSIPDISDSRGEVGPDPPPRHPSSDWLRLFSSQIFSHINTPTFSIPVILQTYLPMKMEQSVPKHWHIKFRHLGITQKKAYNIQDTTKV
jgi:hypothetical protein